MVKKKEKSNFCGQLFKRAIGCFIKWSYLKKKNFSQLDNKPTILVKKFSNIIKKNKKYNFTENRPGVFFYWRNNILEKSKNMINLKLCKYFKNVKNCQDSVNILLTLNNLILFKDFFISYI